MNYLGEHNTLKQLRSITTRTREDAAKLAQLVALSLLEPNTGKTRGILVDLVHGFRESAEILEKLEAAVASQDRPAVEKILNDHCIREA